MYNNYTYFMEVLGWDRFWLLLLLRPNVHCEWIFIHMAVPLCSCAITAATPQWHDCIFTCRWAHEQMKLLYPSSVLNGKVLLSHLMGKCQTVRKMELRETLRAWELSTRQKRKQQAMMTRNTKQALGKSFTRSFGRGLVFFMTLYCSLRSSLSAAGDFERPVTLKGDIKNVLASPSPSLHWPCLGYIVTAQVTPAIPTR